MQVEPLDLCYSQPSQYRLCDKFVCIPWEQKCPCKANIEFRCKLGNCIPLELRCDGINQCLYGEDEEQCFVRNKTEASVPRFDLATRNINKDTSTVKEGLSIPVIVTIASLCIFVSVLVVILFYIFITRRQVKNTSKESQSVTEPLRKSYVTADIENADLRSQYKEIANDEIYIPRRPERTIYLPVDIVFDSDSEPSDPCNVDEENLLKTQTCENSHANSRKNLAINPGAEIYNIDPSSEYRVSGLGKYTFKPRLKYMKSKPYLEIEEKDRDKLYVINSYKHCSGKSILPSTLTFDKDPEKFSTNFATDLLCSSTPRQPLKHLVKKGVSTSTECEI